MKLNPDKPEGQYLTEYTRRYTAINLISFGVIQFSQIEIIKNLDYLKTLGAKIKTQYEDETIKKILQENLIDSTRMQILIENYLKAMLIANNFVAHKISKKSKYKLLKQEQSSRPVKVSELEDIQLSTSKIFSPSDFIDHQTLNFHSLLHRKGYKDFFKLPKPIIDLGERCRLNRNRMHFYNADYTFLGEKIINELEAMIDFVNRVIIPNQNTLCDIVKAPDYHYLKLSNIIT